MRKELKEVKQSDILNLYNNLHLWNIGMNGVMTMLVKRVCLGNVCLVVDFCKHYGCYVVDCRKYYGCCAGFCCIVADGCNVADGCC